MSNNYDIEFKMDICGYDYKPKKEKLKEIAASKMEFRKWVKEKLQSFNSAAADMDNWMDTPNDMTSEDTNEVWSIDKGKWICLD